MNALFLLTSKSDVAYLYDHNDIRQGLARMRIHHYTAIPVITASGDYVGCISEGDFLWALIDRKDEIPDLTIKDLIRVDFNRSAHIDITMETLLERVKVQNFVPITDDRNKFIGIITRKDVICYFQERYEKEQLEQIKPLAVD